MSLLSQGLRPHWDGDTQLCLEWPGTAFHVPVGPQKGLGSHLGAGH